MMETNDNLLTPAIAKPCEFIALDTDAGMSIIENGSASKPSKASNNKRWKYLKYCKAWEKDDRLKDWIAPLPWDERSAYCKVCRRPFHPHKKDLLLHSNSKKHKRNMSLYQDVVASCKPLKDTIMTNEYEIDLPAETNENILDIEFKSTAHKSTITLCSENSQIINNSVNIMGVDTGLPSSLEEMNNWKNIPEFEDWLEIESNNLSCGACNKALKPNKTFIVKHASGKMHKRNCAKKNTKILSPKTEADINTERDLRMSVAFSNDSVNISERIIDTRSDTLTRPSIEMKEAMAQAQLGDDSYGTDPTVKALENKVATLLGKEKGLLCPSGTMANLIAVMTHCWSRDSEVILGDKSHLNRWSQGSLSRLCGIAARPIRNGGNGTFSITALKEMIDHRQFHHWPFYTLVCIENSHTYMGGKVLPLEWINELGSYCKENFLLLHMDGARLMNACLHAGVTPEQFCQPCHSATLCLNKGLGAPMGCVLVGNEEFIARARSIRTLLGGTMHQAGIFAAADLYALEHNSTRLHWDHSNARAIAFSIREKHSSAVRVELDDVETNIIHLFTDNIRVNAQELCDRLAVVKEKELQDLGYNVKLLLQTVAPHIARLVTHSDLSKYDIQLAIQKLKYVIEEYDNMLSLNFGR